LGLFRALVIGAFIVALPLALISTNVRVAISEKAVYDYSVRHYGAVEASGIAEQELIQANGEIHDYLTNQRDGPLAPVALNATGQPEALFSVRETAHMADVQALVAVLFTVQVLALGALVALAVVMLVLWPPRALAAAALYGSVLTACVLVLSSVVAMSGFDSAWSQFHVLAFANDFWELDPQRDHLIQMYPETFWFDITMLIGVATLFEAVVISGACAGYLALSRPRYEPRLLPEPREMPPRPDLRQRIGPPDPRHYTR
jgi:integral membrane protein (TIGR01906 family)